MDKKAEMLFRLIMREIGPATSDSGLGTLSFTASELNASFAVLNTVVNSINKIPNQHTGGEGSATGEEVVLAPVPRS